MDKIKKGGKSPLGEKISQLATARGFVNLPDFADKSEISNGTLNDLVYGKTKLVPDSLIKVAASLGVSVVDLLLPMFPSKAFAQLVKSESREDDKKVDEKTDMLDRHALASEVAAQVVTALKSESTDQPQGHIPDDIWREMQAQLNPDWLSIRTALGLVPGTVLFEQRQQALAQLHEKQKSGAGAETTSAKKSTK